MKTPDLYASTQSCHHQPLFHTESLICFLTFRLHCDTLLPLNKASKRLQNKSQVVWIWKAKSYLWSRWQINQMWLVFTAQRKAPEHNCTDTVIVSFFKAPSWFYLVHLRAWCRQSLSQACKWLWVHTGLRTASQVHMHSCTDARSALVALLCRGGLSNASILYT